MPRCAGRQAGFRDGQLQHQHYSSTQLPTGSCSKNSCLPGQGQGGTGGSCAEERYPNMPLCRSAAAAGLGWQVGHLQVSRACARQCAYTLQQPLQTSKASRPSVQGINAPSTSSDETMDCVLWQADLSVPHVLSNLLCIKDLGSPLALACVRCEHLLIAKAGVTDAPHRVVLLG